MQRIIAAAPCGTLTGSGRLARRPRRALTQPAGAAPTAASATPGQAAGIINPAAYRFAQVAQGFQAPLLVVDTSEIDFVNNPNDLADLIREVDRAGQGVQHYVPRKR